jgi:hypothetical protein
MIRKSKPAWRRRLLIVAGTTALAAIAAGVLSVRLIWGYWLAPPKVEDFVSDVAVVHAFSTFHFDDSVSSGERALASAAKTADRRLGEDPSGRIPAELLRLGARPSNPGKRRAVDARGIRATPEGARQHGAR